MASAGPVDVASICRDTAREFNSNYKCQQCAEAMAIALRAKGVRAELVRLRVLGRTRGFIVVKDAGFKLPFHAPANQAIATNGAHYGVRVGDRIYCSIFRDGIAAHLWPEQFDCDTGQFAPLEVV